MRNLIHNAWQALPSGRSLWAYLLILFVWSANVAYLYADDGLKLSNINVTPGQTKQVGIQLNNSETYTAFQLDIKLPQGISIVQQQDTEGFKLSSRATANHTLSAETFSDGTIRVLVYSASNQAFSGSSGDLLFMTVAVDENFTGPKNIEITNIRFTTTGIQEILFPDITAPCDILTTIIGDVNSDGTVDISDYIGVANHILGNTPEGFNMEAADVNNDGSIDISDYIGVANIILTGKP